MIWNVVFCCSHTLFRLWQRSSRKCQLRWHILLRQKVLGSPWNQGEFRVSSPLSFKHTHTLTHCSLTYSSHVERHCFHSTSAHQDSNGVYETLCSWSQWKRQLPHSGVRVPSSGWNILQQLKGEVKHNQNWIVDICLNKSVFQLSWNASSLILLLWGRDAAFSILLNHQTKLGYPPPLKFDDLCV